MGAGVIDGQRDMYPLLLKVMDAFHDNASAVQRAALARELFSRGGAELLPILAKGSEGIGELTAKLKEMGLVLNADAIKGARELTLAHKELDEAEEGFALKLGPSIQNLKIWTVEMATATLQTLTHQSALKTLGELMGGGHG
jgi:hypothetical protein